MPHLVQLLLPVFDNGGEQFAPELHKGVRLELTQRFGGLTAHTRAPAEGLWDTGDDVKRDDIMVLEVMVQDLDRPWWRNYRGELESRFRQNQIVLRALAYDAL